MKELTVAESMINWCSTFHLSITLSEKKKSLRSSLHSTLVLHNLGTVASRVSRCVESEEVVEWFERQSLEHSKDFQ